MNKQRAAQQRAPDGDPQNPMLDKPGQTYSGRRNEGNDADRREMFRLVRKLLVMGFTPIRYLSVVVSCRSRVSHTEPSRSCLHLQWNLVRPLSLTEELRLCQNIEHYQLSI